MDLSFLDSAKEKLAEVLQGDLADVKTWTKLLDSKLDLGNIGGVIAEVTKVLQSAPEGEWGKIVKELLSRYAGGENAELRPSLEKALVGAIPQLAGKFGLPSLDEGQKDA